MHSFEEKVEAIELVAQLGGYTKASKKLDIPKKYLKRWHKNGPARKDGAGRKAFFNGDQENMVIEIIEEYIREHQKFPSRKIVKLLVLPKFNKIEGFEEFAASKGWFDKLYRRNFNKIVELKTLAKSFTKSAKGLEES